MAQPILIIFTSLVALTTLTSFTTSAPTFSVDDFMRNNSILELEFLGNFEGKGFYADANISMNWTDAGAYCQAVNLELAEIKSGAEADFLKAALASYGIHYFWTAARERRTLEGLAWNGTNTALNDTLGFTSFLHIGHVLYNFCGLLNRDFHLLAQLCSVENHVLCQSKP